MNEDRPSYELDWTEIATAIFAAKGIDSGLWRLGVKVRFAALAMEYPEAASGAGRAFLPTTLSAIESFAVFPAEDHGPMVFDAAAPAVKAKPQRPPAAPSKAAPRKSIKQGSQSIKATDKSPKAKTRAKKTIARPAT